MTVEGVLKGDPRIGSFTVEQMDGRAVITISCPSMHMSFAKVWCLLCEIDDRLAVHSVYPTTVEEEIGINEDHQKRNWCSVFEYSFHPKKTPENIEQFVADVLKSPTPKVVTDVEE